MPAATGRAAGGWIAPASALALGAVAVLGAYDTVLWPLMVAASAGAALMLFWLVRHEMVQTTGQILLGAVALRAVALPLTPTLSDDFYRYLWDGLVLRARMNPYEHLPAEIVLPFDGAPHLLEMMNSPEFYSVYPPVSQAIFFLGALFYQGDPLPSYYVVKGLITLLDLAAVVLLIRMVGRRAVLYAWQPLVVLAFAGQGHSEAAAVLALVAAVYLVRRGQVQTGSAAVGVAALSKMYPVLFLPVLAQRFGWRAVAGGAAVIVIASAPFFSIEAASNVASSLRLYVQYFEFNAGPYLAAKHSLMLLTGSDFSKMLGPIFGLLLIAAVVGTWREAGRQQWNVARTMFWITGFYLLFSTTVHPWYLTVVLALAVLQPVITWAWFWLAAASMGTYLLYVDGPYWTFVVLGWAGFATIAVIQHGRAAVNHVLRARGRRKATMFATMIDEPVEGRRILDLGCAEGFVGAELARRGADVRLADVHGKPEVDLPFTLVSGELPFADAAFDYTLLSFVLHHAEDPRFVLAEALRVSRCGVWVAESTAESPLQARLLFIADRAANALRGEMRPPDLRSGRAWRQLARKLGATPVLEETRGRLIHRQYYVLLRPERVTKE
jgi:SAM-dependent methyltransferase